MAAGDYSRKLKVDWEKVKKAKISLTLKPPIVKKLPCDFEFDANGVRKAVKYLDITFMGITIYWRQKPRFLYLAINLPPL